MKTLTVVIFKSTPPIYANGCRIEIANEPFRLSPCFILGAFGQSDHLRDSYQPADARERMAVAMRRKVAA